MKNRALNIHKSLYQNLLNRTDINKYSTLVCSELGVSSVNDCIFSTSEHIAPFNTINTVSFLLPQLLLQHFHVVEKRDIVILGGSLVPLDNIDYPRGFYWIDEKKRSFNLFSQKYKKSPVLLNDALNYNDIQDQKRDQFFKRFQFLKKEFLFDYQNFATQQSSIMKNIVKKWSFSSGSIFIEPLEYVAKNILIKLLEMNDLSIKLLFENIKLFQEDTYNVFCSWNKTRGTVLFWEVEDKRLNKILYKNNKFIGKNISFSPNLEEVLELLINNRILPSVSLSLFIVSWLPNIPVAGGDRQYWYWQYMIKSFDKIFGINNKNSLSQFGYNHLDFTKLEILSHYGTGLDLTINHVDKEKLFRYVFNLPINESYKKDGFYGC